MCRKCFPGISGGVLTPLTPPLGSATDRARCDGIPHLARCEGILHLARCEGILHLARCEGIPHLARCEGILHLARCEGILHLARCLKINLVLFLLYAIDFPKVINIYGSRSYIKASTDMHIYCICIYLLHAYLWLSYHSCEVML